MALDIDPDLRRGRDLLRFVASAAVAAVIASTSVIVWNASRGYDFSTGQRLWYAWVIGDVLQAALVAVPVRWLGPRARRWARGQMAMEPRSEVTYTRVAVTLALGSRPWGCRSSWDSTWCRTLSSANWPREAGRTELRLRLFQTQLFIGILILALVVATGLVSTTLAQKGSVERRRREAL